MQHGQLRHSALRRPDSRYTINLTAQLVVEEGAPLAVRLVNLSRNGFRIADAPVLPAGQTVRLEVEGWPRLVGRVMWCDHGRIGCLLDTPPSDTAYEMMRAAAQERDREAF
jgi:hypothetical protein